MIVLITYDIVDDSVRNKLHGFMKEFGLNTQKSVFECAIDDIGIRQIRAHCLQSLELSVDSLRIYKICNRCINKVVISGQGLKVTQMEYMIL